MTDDRVQSRKGQAQVPPERKPEKSKADPDPEKPTRVPVRRVPPTNPIHGRW